MHAVLLRQPSRSRWNAFFWGGGFSQANTFARREGAERWLRRLVERHLPTIATSERRQQASVAAGKVQRSARAKAVWMAPLQAGKTVTSVTDPRQTRSRS